MPQPTHTTISHGGIEKEATEKEARPRREKRSMAKELEHISGDSAGRCTTSGTSKEDEIVSIMEECLSMARSGFLQDIKTSDLVFCQSSKEDDAHTPPPLQSPTLATTNNQFLQYQDWIKKLFLDAEKLDCEGFERCISIKCQLLDDLQNELTRLEELRCRAWQLTSRKAGLTMPPCPRADPVSVRKIDTSE